ncbi:MAG: hypothetical protein GY920_18880 [Aliivibrio sp.]|nr:hypothetical protein [Aliivibrio sp.]
MYMLSDGIFQTGVLDLQQTVVSHSTLATIEMMGDVMANQLVFFTILLSVLSVTE